MAAATLVLRDDATDMPCPYVEGATYTLELTLTSGPVLQAQVRVIKPFEPFTMSTVMRVALEKITSPPGATLAQYGLPTNAVLKVYDHRFAHSARKSLDLKPFTLEHEAEYLAYANGPYAPRTLAEMFEDVGEVDAEDDENHPEHLAREHYVALDTASYFTSEHDAYKRLSSLQGRDIPILYGTTRFLGGEAAPSLDLTKPGILLQYIEGTSLELVEPGQVNIDFLARECLRIIEAYSQLGVLNMDVRLGNFIVKPNGSGVVMIDFGISRLRETGMPDREWQREKWMNDEEGDFGTSAQRKWGWNFEHSYRWMVKG